MTDSSATPTIRALLSARKGFLIRAVAFLIDVIGAVMLFVVGSLIVTIINPRYNGFASGAIGAAAWMLVSSFDIWTAASPGKLILQIAIGNADGTPTTFATRVSRWLMKNA